ncbi:MAG TPA: AAA family ATPase [Solirubrobacteraceae bacterium]|nr:AAA family ATPase [Solirubrobacteraceae bacterium]
MAESVELATVLFTDLVGSTRLAASVGPVRADQLREEHFGLLRDALASSNGKEVKNTGDGLMVAFPSASEAVRCAVAMQQLFERRYRQAEQGLHIRIGVGAGEATVKDADYFGVPPTEAARLCAQAPADGILVSGMARALAGRCEGAEFASVGELELKGLPDPIEAFSVSWAQLAVETGASSRWPLPAVLRSVPPVTFVGRRDERAALEEAMKLARSGQRQAMLLSGEPGIGKTRLASYAAHDAHVEGFAVSWGACTEELATPYEPWIAVCTQLVESAPVELLQRHGERHKGELGRLARNLEGRVSDFAEPQTSDPETERYLLFNAVAGLLVQVAEAVPLCIVLDDLHWADAQSLALLKHVLRSTEQGAVLVIATFRGSDLGKDHPLTAVLADLRSLAGVQRIALHGLDADAVAEVMAAIAGHKLDEEGLQLAAQIAAETDGNPFFVGEILRGLTEAGALVFDAPTSRWSIDTSAGITMPESVREVIEHRVERLGEESLETLRLAAVIGREFDLSLLSTALTVEEAGLLDRVEAAMAASVLAESSERVGRFRFAHALINQTLYEGISATRRARMHQRVGEALEELYGQDSREQLAALALHWRLAAVSVDQTKAANYAMRAGQQALEDLSPAEAVKLFADAVELAGTTDTRERCEALIGLGRAQRLSGDAAYRETLLDASRIAGNLADAELAAWSALANNRGYTSVLGQVDRERLAAIERAIELDEPPDRARRARLLALQALELTWDADLARRRSLAEEAIALARSAGDTSALAAAVHGAFFALWSTKTLELRTDFVEELTRLADALGDPALRRTAQTLELYVRVERGEFARATTALRLLQDIAAELGQPYVNWVLAYQTSALKLVHGDLAAGERLAERAFQIGQQAEQPDAATFYGVQLFYLRVFQGRGDEMIAMIAQSAEANPAVTALRAGLASALCWLDRHAEAETILKRAASDRFEHVRPASDDLTALVLYADAAAQTGDLDVAAILYDLIEPSSDQVDWNGVIGYGHARLYLGLLAGVLGDHERADEHLAFACGFHEANTMPVWVARTHLGWAEALAARGDAHGVREHAARALELSREHGYGAFEPRAAALLAAHTAAGA